jgi:hypothetical protein
MDGQVKGMYVDVKGARKAGCVGGRNQEAHKQASKSSLPHCHAGQECTKQQELSPGQEAMKGPTKGTKTQAGMDAQAAS